MPAPSGAPTAPAVTQAPTAGTTAGLYTWSGGAVHHWLFANYTGQTAYLKFQGTVADPATTYDWDVQVASGTMYSSAIPIARLSVWFPATATLQATERTSGIGSGTATYSLTGWPEALSTNPFA